MLRRQQSPVRASSSGQPSEYSCVPLRYEPERMIAAQFSIRFDQPMPFVIIDKGGEPLADFSGSVIVLGTPEEARMWRNPSKHIEEWTSERLLRFVDRSSEQRP